jgi:low affinity Fe/Cu permease
MSGGSPRGAVSTGLRAWLARALAQLSQGVSSAWAAAAALLLAVAWVAMAMLSGFPATLEFPRAWESVLVVVSSLATFVVVFLLQAAQERDTRAVQMKLDELLRAVEGARDHHLVGLERKDPQELEEVEARLEAEPDPSAEDEELRREIHATRERRGPDAA